MNISKFSPRQIGIMKRMFRAGTSAPDIGSKFKCHHSTVLYLIGRLEKSPEKRATDIHRKAQPNPSPKVYHSPKKSPTTYATYLERAGLKKPKIY